MKCPGLVIVLVLYCNCFPWKKELSRVYIVDLFVVP